MPLLNIIPLFGGLLALLLGALVVFKSSQKKQARWVLGTIILLNAHNLFESYLFYNGFDWPWLGLSYLHYHLIGFLFLLYSRILFRIPVNMKLWAGIAGLFTLFRLYLLAPVEEEALAVATTFTPNVIRVVADNLLSILLNIGLLWLAYAQIRQVRFTVDLSQQEKVNYNWLKLLLLFSIILYGAVLLLNVTSVFVENWLIYFKVESVINSLLSLTWVYASMRIPVFSIHGDYQDLEPAAQKKYLKSSLNSEGSDQAWREIQQLMEETRPYLNPEYRLNDLAESLGRSVHHVSQAINEQEGIGFSDFISRLRVQQAKALLDAGRASQVTILAISLESGFNSKTAFYSAFKKVTGMSPTAYLKENPPTPGP